MQDPIHDELDFHFAQLKQERLAAGDSEAQATFYARRKLGNNLRIEEDVRDLSLYHRGEAMLRRARFALRSYRPSHHGHAYLLATGILALGIGLSVAMFSLVHAVVLSPLPFRAQEAVHLVWKTDTQTKEQMVGELAYPELADLRSNPEIESVALIPAALYGNGRVIQTGTDEPVQIESCPTTADLFKVLGVTPALGRDFTEHDEAVIILSDHVWRAHFGASRSVIGTITRLNSIGHTIIGVMPPEVDFPRGVGLWVPLRPYTNRGMTWLQAVVRAKPGVSRQQLLASTERTFQNQIKDHLKFYSVTQHAVVTPIADFLTGSSKAQLLLSLSASLLLLLSAGVSASNLFLSRTLARRREVATRMSLGASRGQILGQFAIEAFIAAALATSAGSLFAYTAIQLLVRWAPADIPRIATAQLDPIALSFAALVALLATLACLVGPALLLRDKNVESLLRGIRTAGSRTGRRLQNAFVFSQAALTVTILAVGLLLFISYQAMLQTDSGFAHPDTLTMNLALRGPRAGPASVRQFYTDLLERLHRAPEVTSAAGILLRPLEGPIGWDTEYTFEFEGDQRPANLFTKANFEVVTPRYFETIGTALLSGRDVNERDTEDAPKVVVINRTLANRIRAAGHEPLGQRMRVFGAQRQIVGVVADARYRRIVEAMDDVFVPYRQANAPTNYLVIRGTAPTAELLALVRRTLKEIDPTLAIAGEATLGELLARHTARQRFNLSIMLLFAIGAIVLAAAGIHSVIGESIAVRAKEIAVKIALGAGRRRIISESIRPALIFVVLGEMAGLAAALLAEALIAGAAAADLLYAVTPSDPRVLASVAALVFAVAAIAAFVPAWAATNQDFRETLQAD